MTEGQTSSHESDYSDPIHVGFKGQLVRRIEPPSWCLTRTLLR